MAGGAQAELLAKLGVDGAAEDEGRAQHVGGRHGLAQQQGGEYHGRERLQVAADGHARHGQLSHGREVHVAAKAGVDQADAEGGGHVEVGEHRGARQLDGAGGCREAQVDGNGGKASAKLDGGALHTADLGDLLAEDDHDSVHDRAHGAQEEAPGAHALAQALAHHEEGANGHGRKAQDLLRGEARREEHGGERHHDDGAAVEEQRRHTHANVAVGLKEEEPCHAESCAGDGQAEGLLGVLGRLQVGAGGAGERNQHHQQGGA